MSGLVLKGIVKRFGSVLAVKNINLNLPQGKFISFLGPSGCGKTTLLRLVAGLETPSEGTISLDVDAFPNQKVKSLLSTYGLSEKVALDFSNMSRLVRRTIDTHQPSVEFGDLQDRITQIDKRLTAIEKRKTALSSMRGLPYWALIALSRLLIRAGKKIQHELGS